MITTVCMNPSFDKTATVENFRIGELNRLEQPRIDAGGKGINVALVLKQFGVEVQCLSCVGEENKDGFLRLLADADLHHEYLQVKGRVRTNLKIYDKESRSITELNDSGISLSAENIEEFQQLLVEKTQDSEYVVFSGSLPEGCTSKTYQHCMKALNGKKCVLDSSGEALLYGISEKPYLIKPNLSEIEGVMKKELRTLRSLRDAAMFLMQYGAQNVIISMGKYGAMLVVPETSYYAPALMVEAKSTVGAGDCLIGGFLSGLVHGARIEDAFRCSIAAAAAAVMTEGTQPIQLSDYEALLPKVNVQEV